MKRVALLACVGFLGLTQFASAGTSITVNTVGVVNPNNKTIVDATGDSFTNGAFSSAISTAFANDTGGVWNFDSPAGFDVSPGQTVTLSYGTSANNSEVLTLGGSSTFDINQGAVAGEATSGSFELGLAGDAGTRTFALSTPALLIGIYNTNRGDSSRTSVLTVTFQDSTTASTSGANGGATYFQGLTGTMDNPIVSFSLSQSNFIRYDDLGFVVAPEPTSAAAGLIGCCALLLRRRRSVKR